MRNTECVSLGRLTRVALALITFVLLEPQNGAGQSSQDAGGENHLSGVAIKAATLTVREVASLLEIPEEQINRPLDLLAENPELTPRQLLVLQLKEATRFPLHQPSNGKDYPGGCAPGQVLITIIIGAGLFALVGLVAGQRVGTWALIGAVVGAIYMAANC